MTLSRRGFLAGLIASPAIVRFSSLMPVKLVYLSPPPLIVPADPLFPELAAVVRRAFIPRLYVQIYQASPTMALLRQVPERLATHSLGTSSSF